MIIRKATSEDINIIISLWEKSGLPTRPNGRDNPERLNEQMKNPNMCILVAEENSILVGAVLVTHDTRKGWINRLAVLPEHRHKGFAEKLLQASETLLDEQGIDVYAALISSENTPSRALFEKNNYRYLEDITYYAKKKSSES